jgi:MFS family permease
MNRSERPSAFVPSKSRLRWLMLGLVWLLYVSFGITSGTIAPLVSPIVDDLNMTYSQMGLVLGAWQLVYIVTAYPLGTLIDRFGVRRSLGVGVFVVWLSLILRGVAGDFPTLFLAVALFGVGGPIISIGAPKVVSLWFEGNERGLAAGIYTTGPVTGVAIALATAASVVMPLTGSWRGISLIYGVVVLVIMVMWWGFARDIQPHLGNAGQASGESVSLMGTLGTLLRIRNVQVIVVLAVATFLLNHGLNNWLPTLLQERDMTLTQAGFWTAVSTLAGAFGLLFIPLMARHGYRTMTMAVLLLLASATTVGLATLNDTSLIGTLMISSIVRVPMMPVLTLILMETRGVGALRMGAAGGLFFAAAEIGGFGGPVLLGIIRDVTDSLGLGVLFLAVLSAVLALILPLIREQRR